MTVERDFTQNGLKNAVSLDLFKAKSYSTTIFYDIKQDPIMAHWCHTKSDHFRAKEKKFNLCFAIDMPN